MWVEPKKKRRGKYEKGSKFEKVNSNLNFEFRNCKEVRNTNSNLVRS